MLHQKEVAATVENIMNAAYSHVEESAQGLSSLATQLENLVKKFKV